MFPVRACFNKPDCLSCCYCLIAVLACRFVGRKDRPFSWFPSLFISHPPLFGFIPCHYVLQPPFANLVKNINKCVCICLVIRILYMNARDRFFVLAEYGESSSNNNSRKFNMHLCSSMYLCSSFNMLCLFNTGRKNFSGKYEIDSLCDVNLFMLVFFIALQFFLDTCSSVPSPSTHHHLVLCSLNLTKKPKRMRSWIHPMV